MAAMPNETGKDGRGTAPVETCGHCGARVEPGAELCGVCGALLSAYRTPVVTADEVLTPTVEGGGGSTLTEAVRTGPLPRAPFQMPARGGAVPEPELAVDEDASTDLAMARAELLATMLGPEQRLVNAIQADALSPSPITPPAELVLTVRKPAAVVPGPVSASRVQPAEKRRAAKRPKKPGFVAIGSIEPVVMIGGAIFVIAVFVGLLSSIVDFRFGSAVALVFGTVGIVTIVFAMLIALVRKDQDRR